MKQKILVLISLGLISLFSVLPQPVLAADDGSKSCGMKQFLGFRPWYYGLCENGEIYSPKNDEELTSFVWAIVMNILFDMTLVVGYLAVGFVIYGGYQYISSQGDPGKVAKGKRTLTSAIIGTVVSLTASVIVNTLRVALGLNGLGWSTSNFTKKQIQNVFYWAYSAAGIIAVAFIIRGAFEYLTSQGDPNKTHKATMSIVYAVVGLIIVLLAAVITSFVTGAVGGAL